MKPYFSVIIPTYNRWPLLREALVSVCRQTCRELEILVVDDGSTDETKAQVECLRGPIRLLSCHRGGPARARNVGIREACGAFIAFLDSDDLWLPEHLAGAWDIIGRHPQIDFLFADARLIRAAGVRASYLRDKPIEAVPFDAEGSWRIFHRTVYPELVQDSTVTTSSAIVRRERLQDIGGFDERLTPFGEDTDLWLRICARSHAAANWSVTVERRKLPGGLMSSGQELLWRSKGIELFHDHAVRVGKPYRPCIYRRLAGLYQERAIIRPHQRTYGMAVADLFRSIRYDPAGCLAHLGTLVRRAGRWLGRQVSG